MNFIAIDFETANSNRTSICSLGVAIVEHGRIVETAHILIRPTPNYYHPFNSELHGITDEHTRDKATFKSQWKNLKRYFHNQVIIAHNASFDCSALRYALDDSRLPYPDLSYHCTYRLAQKHLDIQSHRLNAVSAYFNIQLAHHNAESDAKACAEIAIRLCQKNGVDSLKELSVRTGFQVGELSGKANSYKPYSKKK